MLSSTQAWGSFVFFVPAILWSAGAPPRLYYNSTFSTPCLRAIGVGRGSQQDSERAAFLERYPSTETWAFLFRAGGAAASQWDHRAGLSQNDLKITIRGGADDVGSLWLGSGRISQAGGSPVLRGDAP